MNDARHLPLSLQINRCHPTEWLCIELNFYLTQFVVVLFGWLYSDAAGHRWWPPDSHRHWYSGLCVYSKIAAFLPICSLRAHQIRCQTEFAKIVVDRAIQMKNLAAHVRLHNLSVIQMFASIVWWWDSIVSGQATAINCTLRLTHPQHRAQQEESNRRRIRSRRKIPNELNDLLSSKEIFN